MKKALIVVDLQIDFCPGGALAVPEGDRIVPVINGLIPGFEIIVYTRDWHPKNHVSFAEKPEFLDKSWPSHCVANTRGADFHPDLNFGLNVLIIDKATTPEVEAYSGFQDTNLAKTLKRLEVDTVYITGLATDYCVKATALDAVREGFKVFLVEDACKGVDSPPGSVKQALAGMEKAGVRIISVAEVKG